VFFHVKFVVLPNKSNAIRFVEVQRGSLCCPIYAEELFYNIIASAI